MEKTSMEKINGIKNYLKQNFSKNQSVEEIRKLEAASLAMTQVVEGVTVCETDVDGMKGEWIKGDNCLDSEVKVILYLHGNSFVGGSCDTHRELASRLSKASGVRVLLFEYRLAPENKYPAANEDCLKAYNYLLDSGVKPQNIIIGGESVGGYLVLMTLLSLRNSGEALPRAAFLLSPHTDFLYFDGESYKTRASLDPTGSVEGAKMCRDFYFDKSITEPSVLSPLNEDLSKLPPLFIQVGDHEVILSDSTRLAQGAKKAGVKVTLEIWENMWHSFRFMASMLGEGEEAINNIGKFVKEI